VDVVAPVPEQPGVAPTERLLTLTACHPMYSARERFIVYAEFTTWQPKSAGRPGSLAAVDPPSASAPGTPSTEPEG
jgi:sortase A